MAIWSIALGYLLIEGLEAFSNRQILNLAIFATLYALAIYQYSMARYCLAMGRKTMSASVSPSIQSHVSGLVNGHW